MLVAYVVITVAAAIVFACAAVLSITGHPSVIRTAEAVRVPTSWMVPLGAALAAGSLGLVAGFVIPALGTVAACGLVLYFTGAAVAHFRVHDTNLNNWINWAIFFALAVGTLSVALAHHGPA
ncbi:MAG: DoxX family protein [Hamadaea sp.]|uniref:DoxX family protein n=1 Tax=Hamadaea sp. TaxID=2024425 RepID=UPI00185DFF8B|nr:DoxX family protein [Hamadaea sp.]NUT18765.1 DoxX family protein [Hamadaea sp.]